MTEREALALAIKHFVPEYGDAETGIRPDAARRIRAAASAGADSEPRPRTTVEDAKRFGYQEVGDSVLDELFARHALMSDRFGAWPHEYGPMGSDGIGAGVHRPDCRGCSLIERLRAQGGPSLDAEPDIDLDIQHTMEDEPR